MNLRLRLGLALGMSAGIVGACSHHKDNPPPQGSSLTGSGGTFNSGAGRGGSGGHKTTTGGSAGESGAAGDNGGSSAGTRANGRGGTSGNGNGDAGGSEAGGGGVPYSGDMGSGGTGGGGGVPGPGDETGHLFVGPGGYDGATGTRDNPFLTLAGAVSMAKAGDTVVFLDGNYDIAKGADPVTIPDGVDLAADNPRFAGLVGTGGTLLELAGDTHIDGLRFDGFETVVASVATGASVSVTRATFTNCPTNSGKDVFEIGGSATVTVTDDAMHDLGDCTALAHVHDQGKLTLKGETLHFTGNGEPAVFTADGSGALALSDLIADDGNVPLLVLRDSSTTTLATSTFETLASHLVELGGSASLAVTNSELSLGSSVTNPGPCIQTTGASSSSLSLTHAVLHDCSGALVGPAPKTLTLDDAEIYRMTESGLDLTTGASSNVTITASNFHHEGARAVRLGGGSPSTFALEVRGTELDAATVPSGFELDGDAASTWDFGTLADPGLNTLTATTTALDVQSSAITSVSAVGNRWTPSVQNADGTGQYVPASSPGVLEVTSGSGQNYSDAAGATIRLAETN